jgi:long-chain acyl-CoA synthetase
MIASGGPRNSVPGTLAHLFFEAIRQHDKPDALQAKVNGTFRPISSRVVAERVRHLALGLAELGVAAGERVAIFSENRPEWAIADFACVTSGIVDVPLYPNLPPEQAAFILNDAGAVVIFVSDAEQAAKIAQVRAHCRTLRHVVTFAAAPHAGADATLAQVEARGAAVDEVGHRDAYLARALATAPDDLATLIYTSGTTGAPKGVMLTHDNLVSNVRAAAAQIPFEVSADTCLSFLPLSHIFERMAGHYLMVHVGASIAYAESIDTVPVDMQTVRPTLVLSVPRLYEKMYARVLENALAGGAVKSRIFFWARRVGERWADLVLDCRTPGVLLKAQYSLAQKLVFSKLRARTGERLRYFVSGGAPLSAEINKFFYAAGLVILEGYGLTETSPVITVNTPTAFRIGTVGKPLPGVEVSIAADGEILTRGPHVMLGYYQNDEATREAIDADGWFHTGDIGELRDGYLAITDRKKDIIVTAGGKNIAPQPIEGLIKTNKYVSQAVVIGDKRKFPVVLVVPNWEQLEKFAKGRQLMWTSRSQLLATPVIQDKMEQEVLGQLHDLARFETPKRVALLEHDFSIERGELTPTLKVKRRVIDKTYKSTIDALYADDEGTATG